MDGAKFQVRSAGKHSPSWVLLAAVLGSSMVFLDGSTVNVALPALQSSLGATLIDVQWVVNGYTLFLAALLLLGGALGDRYGRRGVFLAGVVIFTAASVWCGLAPTVPHLIAARAAQGIGGALLTPGSLALINANYPSSQRGHAIGLWSAFTAIAAGAGPVVGGWLIDTLSWRWIFFMNVPLALAVLLIGVTRVPQSRGLDTDGHLDWLGSLFVTLGLGGVVFALLESSARGAGDALVLAAASGGVLFLALFLLVEARSEAPILPLRLFRSRTFSGVNVITLLIYAVLAGLFFFLPMYLIQVHGYSATAAGAAGLPFVALLFLLSSWSGGLYDRYGPRLPLMVGSVVVGASAALFALLGANGSFLVAVTLPMTVLGFGMALIVAPLTTTVMASVADELAGTASGANNAVSRVAGLLAIGLFGAVMVAIFAAQLDRGLAELDLSAATRQQLQDGYTQLAALLPPPELDSAASQTVTAAIHAAFASGYRVILWVMAAMALAAAIVAQRTTPHAPLMPVSSSQDGGT